ncbi:MAG: HAMP domain-containing sensor histidine kinase [Planctomycetota bacterium]
MQAGRAAGIRGRQALYLYVVLVVLPAACFGLLLLQQLRTYQTRLLNELPADARDGADRLGQAITERVTELLEDEMARPFEEYSETLYRPDGDEIVRDASPLGAAPLREGVLGYFAFDASEIDPERAVTWPEDAFPPLEIYTGVTDERGLRNDSAHLSSIAHAVTIQWYVDDEGYGVQDALESAEMEGFGQTRQRRVRTSVLNLSQGEERECRDAVRDNAALFDKEHHLVHVSHFHLQVVEPVPFNDGPQWAVVATRYVVMEGLTVPTIPTCIERIARPVFLIQGFVLDNRWLLDALPREEARSVLGRPLRLASMGETVPDDPGVTVAEVDVFDALGLYLGAMPESGFGVRVVTDASGLRRGFAIQNAWLAGMALLLTISMTIGIRLLLGSIRASRGEAERTRNFVASVTHELRTPIAAVKLYGEMLRDGWVTGEERRDEYLGRIVSESDRLDGLVDRVLLRRRLYDGTLDEVGAGDLNAHVLAQRADLEMVGGRSADDLAFELAEELPPVLLTAEGIHVILQNLVENARKYAPVERDADGAPVEPILVRTRRDGRRGVLLEVLDRGPGIDEKDRGRIFEAFRRLGDEHTRRTKGTGLGLHLVSLQARALRGKVQALPRVGGGSVFQVSLKKA